MPIPKPKKEETFEEYMPRCSHFVGNDKGIIGDKEGQEKAVQVYAVCKSEYDRHVEKQREMAYGLSEYEEDIFDEDDYEEYDEEDDDI
jgi:hypothetical protein